jgi:SAM-dependent methyltransferase
MFNKFLGRVGRCTLRLHAASVRRTSVGFYLFTGLIHYGFGVLTRPFRSEKLVGTVESNLAAYAVYTRGELGGQRLEDLTTPEELYYGAGSSAHRERWTVVNGRLARGSHFEANKYILNRLAERIEQYTTDAQATESEDRWVVEFGCGTGRNLLYLAQRFPNLRFLGLEQEPSTVAFAKSAAEKWGLDIEFIQANVCAPVTGLPKNVEIAFSMHALEWMPGIFTSAVQNMIGCSTRAAMFYEPVWELWPWSLRGIVSRLRILHHDYIRGLLSYIRKLDYPIVEANRLSASANPLNETCEIIVAKQ